MQRREMEGKPKQMKLPISSKDYNHTEGAGRERNNPRDYPCSQEIYTGVSKNKEL